MRSRTPRDRRPETGATPSPHMPNLHIERTGGLDVLVPPPQVKHLVEPNDDNGLGRRVRRQRWKSIWANEADACEPFWLVRDCPDFCERPGTDPNAG